MNRRNTNTTVSDLLQVAVNVGVQSAARQAELRDQQWKAQSLGVIVNKIDEIQARDNQIASLNDQLRLQQAQHEAALNNLGNQVAKALRALSDAQKANRAQNTEMEALKLRIRRLRAVNAIRKARATKGQNVILQEPENPATNQHVPIKSWWEFLKEMFSSP